MININKNIKNIKIFIKKKNRKISCKIIIYQKVLKNLQKTLMEI